MWIVCAKLGRTAQAGVNAETAAGRPHFAHKQMGTLACGDREDERQATASSERRASDLRVLSCFSRTRELRSRGNVELDLMLVFNETEIFLDPWQSTRSESFRHPQARAKATEGEPAAKCTTYSRAERANSGPALRAISAGLTFRAKAALEDPARAASRGGTRSEARTGTTLRILESSTEAVKRQTSTWGTGRLRKPSWQDSASRTGRTASSGRRAACGFRD